MTIFGKKIDSAAILNGWHYLGMVVTGAGFIAKEAAPLVGANPKAAAVVAMVGAGSLTATAVMTRIANNKIVQSIINDPSSPTPQGMGIPTPEVSTDSAVQAAVMTAPTPTAGALALAQNVAAFKAAVTEAAK